MKFLLKSALKKRKKDKLCQGTKGRIALGREVGIIILEKERKVEKKFRKNKQRNSRICAFSSLADSRYVGISTSLLWDERFSPNTFLGKNFGKRFLPFLCQIESREGHKNYLSNLKEEQNL
jgi:hypothetical protein